MKCAEVVMILLVEQIPITFANAIAATEISFVLFVFMTCLSDLFNRKGPP